MQVMPPTISLRLDGAPLAADLLRILHSVEVESEVRKQALVRLRLTMGQAADGDWASANLRRFEKGKRLTVDATVGGAPRRLINGFLTEFRMNFSGDPCQSTLELVGTDALFRAERKNNYASSATDLRALVSQIFNRAEIQPMVANTPANGTPNPTRDQLNSANSDLELLRRLAEEQGCDVFVEPHRRPI